MNIKPVLHPYHRPPYKGYASWRDARVAALNEPPEPTLIRKPEQLSSVEEQHLLQQIQSHNMALFHIENPEQFDSLALRQLGQQLGLQRLDSNLYADENAISELRVIDKGRRGEYIPYTNRGLGWHTDGYYNIPEKSIYAFTLYCQQPAADGGENQLLNPELAYIHL